MKDKSLGTMLAVLFGASGLVVVLLGWLLPSLAADRPIATAAGVFGLVVSARALKVLGTSNRQSP